MAVLTVDTGTTSTRVWVMDEGSVIASTSGSGGARDVARGQDREWLASRVREIADGVLDRAGRSWDQVAAAVAFGMITSELGLEEVPHLDAPVARRDLVQNLRERTFSDHLPVPVFLVPGVRCLGETLEDLDFMRGEETEVVGLLDAVEIDPPFLFVSTGSHTKFVYVDDKSRIAWSVTTLSGELLWALRKETILAELVDPDGELSDLADVEEGARVATRVGLSRALFAARLMNRMRGAEPSRCSDLVHGAVAQADLMSLGTALARRGDAPGRIVVSGRRPLAVAYRHLIAREPWANEVLSVNDPLGALGAYGLYESRQGVCT